MHSVSQRLWAARLTGLTLQRMNSYFKTSTIVKTEGLVSASGASDQTGLNRC